MGFPITQQVLSGGSTREFAFYAWFIDRAGGPVWQEMDEAFDRWDRITGRHVAFFVDPFQKKEWALKFLQQVLDEPAAIEAVLGAQREAQRFFRERLAERACDELWLPRERLPIVLIGCRWDASTTLAVPLATRGDVGRLLQLLTVAGREPERTRRLSTADGRARPGWGSEEDARLQWLERRLKEHGFKYQLTDVRRGMTRFGGGELADVWRGPFSKWLHHQAASPWQGVAPHMAGTVTDVVVSSFDDIILLAHTFARETGHIARWRQGALFASETEDSARWRPGDPQAADMIKCLSLFAEAVSKLREVRSVLHRMAEGGVIDDQLLEDGAAVVGGVRLHNADNVFRARIAERLGSATFDALQEQSKSALVASEVICSLSDAIFELHHDLSAVLLGYWKASEIEGRRLIVDLINTTGGVPVWSKGEQRVSMLVDSGEVQRSFAAGAIANTLCNAHFDPQSAFVHLPLSSLGEQYWEMSHVTRNRFIHRENLQDADLLDRARSLVAAPPNGILPRAVMCIGEVAAAAETLVGPLPVVTRLLGPLERGNASASVPMALSALSGRARGDYATGAVAKLGAAWLNDRRATQPWVVELMNAVPAVAPPGDGGV
jgi:hypothetical protein